MAKYEEVRDKINSGDIIAFNVSPAAPKFSHILKLFTGRKVYHVGVAVWLYSSEGDRRLFIAEAGRGNRQIVPLSLYANESIDVYEAPVDFSKISESLLSRIGAVDYSYLDLLTIWLREQLGLKTKNFKGQVCSEMIVEVLEDAGYQCGPILVSPYCLVEQLKSQGVNLKFEIR